MQYIVLYIKIFYNIYKLILEEKLEMIDESNKNIEGLKISNEKVSSNFDITMDLTAMQEEIKKLNI